MNYVLDFPDRTIPPPSDTQIRRLAHDLNKVSPYAVLLQLSDRTTPFLATSPIWKDNESLRLLRLVDKYLIPEVVRRLKAGAKDIECGDESAAAAAKTMTGDNCGDTTTRKRDRWIRLAKITLITVAVTALAAFVAAYDSSAPNPAAEIGVAPSPEIRRATPEEPEIRRAIPVEPEIRKAIPVHRTRAGARRKNSALTK